MGVRRIIPLTFGIFHATVFGFAGLVLGIIYSFGGLVYDLNSDMGFNTGTILAFGALVGMPLILAIAGFTFGLIEAMIYNLIIAKFHPIKKNWFEEQQR